MSIEDRINRYLDGESDEQERLSVISAIAFDPEWKAVWDRVSITRMRLNRSLELEEEYGSFIPAGSLAADDGHNLCDIQCEAYLLRCLGVAVDADTLARESRDNYWLRDQGVPLYNMGKLLETNGYVVHRSFAAPGTKAADALAGLVRDLKEKAVIVVVNSDTLAGRHPDVLAADCALEASPNHAVVVNRIDAERKRVTLFNPAETEAETDYDLDRFVLAWSESRFYKVTARPCLYPDEYDPQPMDLSDVELDPELMKLMELIAENNHDVWGREKKDEFPGIRYAPLVDGQEQPGCNHYLLPYALLPECDREPDRREALNTLKTIKRLGWRIVNVKSMYKCPRCGAPIEMSDHFCRDCGHPLGWEDFK